MANNTFSQLEMLKISMLMEEEGYNSYKSGADNTTGEVREFLLNSANEELSHKGYFSNLYNKMSEGKELESEYLFDDEVTKYLRLLIENQVYDRKDEKKDSFKDLKSAVKSSLESEELTVRVYTEMYNGITQDDAKEVLNKIIEEEKQHAEYFAKMLKQLEA